MGLLYNCIRVLSLRGLGGQAERFELEKLRFH